MTKGKQKGQIYLDSWDLRIFNVIEEKKGASVGEILDSVGLTPTNFFIHLNRLEAIGLIKKEQDKTIPQRYNLYPNEQLLSKNGREFLKTINETFLVRLIKQILSKKINKSNKTVKSQ